MGRQLLTEEPVFRRVIQRCDELIQEWGGWSLRRELTAEESASRLHETAIAQPAIFAIQVALAELWQSWGIVPDAVVGHSVGEVAAGYLSGVLTFEDAVTHHLPSRPLYGLRPWPGEDARGVAQRRRRPRDDRALWRARCLGGDQ